MYCGKCGTQLEPQDRFCPECGAPVSPGPGNAPGAYDGSMSESQTWVLPDEDENALPESGGADAWDPGQGAAWIEDDVWEDQPQQAIREPERRINDAPPSYAADAAAQRPKGGRKMDQSERHELVLLTREEAIAGCRKEIEIDGQILTIDVPPNLGPKESLYFQGYGYRDTATGRRGPLKVQFLID